MHASAPGCISSRAASVGPSIARASNRAGVVGGGASSDCALRTTARVHRRVRVDRVVAMPLSTGASRLRAVTALATRLLAPSPSSSFRAASFPFLGARRRATTAAANPDDDDASPPSGNVVDATDETSVDFADLTPALHPDVVAALTRLGFERATPLQTRAVPTAADTMRDCVVAAETGSGKTLSYLLPVFSNLLTCGHTKGTTGRLGALILAPNATLCEQVAKVANSLVSDDSDEPLLKVLALTPDAAMPSHDSLPDVIVATPARAAEDVLEFTRGGWRRGNFSNAAVHIRHVVFDEADQLLSGGYLKPVRGAFDVLYREEKLAALGLTVAGSNPESDEWSGDTDRPKDGGDRAWAADHADINAAAKSKSKRRMGQGAALGGKGEVGVGEGREFRRQYIFAAATVMSNGKKTPGAMIKYGFPDASWVEGRRLHKAVATLSQTWVEVNDSTRADALGRALSLGTDAQNERTLVFVNSTNACEEVTAELIRQGLSAASFHADVSTKERGDRLDQLANGSITALVCTDSAARGVDVPDVKHVIQAEFAPNAVDYLHRIGRTARCGADGRVTNLIGGGDKDLADAVRDAESSGRPVESAFSRKRSFRKKFKKYGPSRTAPQNRR